MNARSHSQRAARPGALLDAAAALARSEAALARAELRQGLVEARRGLAAFAFGLVILHAAVFGGLGAAILALGLVWPLWLATGVVAGGALVLGGLCLAVGRRRIARAVPRHTLREVRAALALVTHPLSTHQEEP